MNRTERRKAMRVKRPPLLSQLEGVLRSEGPGEVKQAARVWLRFPATPRHNIVARSSALAKRRAAAKRAKQARKVTRRAAK